MTERVQALGQEPRFNPGPPPTKCVAMSKLGALSEPRSPHQGNGGVINSSYAIRSDVKITETISAKCLACCLTYGKKAKNSKGSGEEGRRRCKERKGESMR